MALRVRLGREEVIHVDNSRWTLRPIALQTDRLRIRPFDETDIDARYLGWLNDAAHMQFSNQRFMSHSESTARSFMATFDGCESQFLAIEHAGTLAGTTTVHLIPEHGVADIGILIGSQYEGKGLGREAIRAIADELVVQGVRKVTIGTSAANLGMIGLMKGLGFAPDGRRSRQELVDGVETDLVYFARFSRPHAGT
jgi:RimJ/RimL family protein N-acetyltransferase